MGIIGKLFTALTLLLLLVASILLFIGSFSTDFTNDDRPLFTAGIAFNARDLTDIPLISSIQQSVLFKFGLWGVCFSSEGVVDLSRTCGSYAEAAANPIARRVEGLSDTLRRVNDIAVPALISVHLVAASFLAVLFIYFIFNLFSTHRKRFFIIPILLALITILLLIAVIVAIAIFYVKVRNAFNDSPLPVPADVQRGTAFTVTAAAVGVGLLACLCVLAASLAGCLGARKAKREQGKTADQMEMSASSRRLTQPHAY